MKTNILITATLCAAFIFTSIYNPKTADAICMNYTITKDLKLGVRASDVEALQTFLVTTGYLKMPANTPYGYFGPATKKAVIGFQANSGLKADGSVGRMTRALINNTIHMDCAGAVSNAGSANAYVPPATPVWPTDAQIAAMPVYTATLTGNQNTALSAKITSPTNGQTVVIGSQIAFPFTLKASGGTGNYRSFWSFDNLDTPNVLYDESSSDTYVTSAKERTMLHAITKGPSYWIATAYVMDETGQKSPSDSIYYYVATKSLADKIDAMRNGSDYASDYASDYGSYSTLRTDPEYIQMQKQTIDLYAAAQTHPAYKDLMNEGESRSLTAVTQANLSSVRAQAELYYSLNNNSYTGVCSDKDILRLFAEAEKGATGKINCSENANYWRAFATLKQDGSFWCVDSAGASMKATTIKGYKCELN